MAPLTPPETALRPARRNQVYAVFGIGAMGLLMLVGGALSLHNLRNLNTDARSVAHTHLVRTAASEVLVDMLNAETGMRGYLLSGEEDFLEPLLLARQRSTRDLDTLRTLTHDNGGQALRVDSLRRMVDEAFARFDTAIASKRSFPARPVRMTDMHTRKEIMDGIRARVAAIQGEEHRLLEARQQASVRSLTFARASTVFFALGGTLLLFVILVLVRRRARKDHAHTLQVLRQHAWFRTTLASIGDGVMATDAQGNVTFMNAVAEDYTGWNAEAAHGRPHTEVFHIVNETTRAPVPSPVDAVIATGRGVELENHTVLLARDGRELAIEDSASPIRGADQQLAGVVLVFRDVSAENERKKSLLAAHALNSALLRSAPDAIITFNAHGLIQDLNPAAEKMFGLDRAHCLQQPLNVILQFPGSADGFAHGNWIERTGMDTHASLANHIDVLALHANGRRFPAEMAVVAVRDHATPLFTAHLRDISTRKALEDELRRNAAELSEADRRKSEFLAILAHELRNPLAPITHGLELLEDEVTGADGRRVLSIMRRQTTHMVRLIDDLLDLTRVSRGKIELRKEPIELAPLLEHAIEQLRPSIEKQGHTLIVRHTPAPVRINADGARITQVVGNLLSNAAKFTPPGGRIELNTEQTNGHVTITVTDNGMGIADKDLSRVFDMFTQLHTELDSSNSGLGIGLSLVRRLVEMHDGSVRVESAGPGKGSTFTVKLPVVKTEGPAPSIERSSADPQAHFSRVLVVDDNVDAALTMELVLRRAGHKVIVAHNGLEAVAAAREHVPDIIVMDIGMPLLNGYEAAKRIRAIPELDRCHMVALTGWGQESDKVRSQEAGFSQHMVKPINAEELAKVIRELQHKRANGDRPVA